VAQDARFEVAPPRGEQDARSTTARNIADGVMSRGSRWIAPTKVLDEGQKSPKSGLLIEGAVLRAEQGSRALRIGIDFGGRGPSCRIDICRRIRCFGGTILCGC
jgi:hypothetical protein